MYFFSIIILDLEGATVFLLIQGTGTFVPNPVLFQMYCIMHKIKRYGNYLIWTITAIPCNMGRQNENMQYKVTNEK